MSDYPATPSYGIGYGAQDQSNPPYLPPTYPNQYMPQNDGRMGQAGMPSNYDASMSTYGYNGAVPPFSASAVAPSVPPLPLYQGWNQDAPPLPPYAPAHAGPQYSGYSTGVHQQQNTQYYGSQSQHTYQQNQPAARNYDEGELSEGEFEGNTGSTNKIRAASGYGTNQSRTNETGFDTAQQCVYPGAPDTNSQHLYRSSNNYNYPPLEPPESPQSKTQPSNAYSAYDSSRDYGEQGKANQSPHVPSHTGGQVNWSSKNQDGWVQGSATNPSTALSTNGSSSQSNGKAAATDSGSVQTSASISTASNEAAGPSPSAALLEARKQAENAILNLWPYEVRFQQYIDEGFSESIIAGLFDHLKMSRTSSKSMSGTGDKAENVVASESRPSPLSALPNGQQPSSSGSGPRKASSSLQEAVGAKSAGLTDKEKTLQSKMEALRKSREERAQKAAAKNSAKSPTDPAPTQSFTQSSTQPSVPKIDAEVSNVAPKPAPPPIQPPSSAPSLISQSSGQTAPTQQRGPIIPGLFLSSTAPSPAPAASTPTSVSVQTNQRKRPVAADFDTPASSLVKRPFGQSRNDRPLVIDVSDEEPDSDDEDVAMDLESQADQDSPMQSSIRLSGQRSMSMQALTDYPTQKYITPPSNSSAPGTPPRPQNAPRPAMGRPEVLQRKESEIELLKKRIAEAEARKKARQTSSGNRTPRATEPLSTDTKDNIAAAENLASKVEASMKMQQLIDAADDKVNSGKQKLVEAQAAEIDKATELRKTEADRNRLRREKLASELPLVDAEVQQSQTKLAQLKAEIAKLEADVEKNLAAKREMAKEMEHLGQEAEDQLQAQKEKLQNLTSEEIASNRASSPRSTVQPAEELGVDSSIHSSHPVPSLPPASTGTPQSEAASRAISATELDILQLPSRGPKIQEETTVEAANLVSNEDTTYPAPSQSQSDAKEPAPADQTPDVTVHAEAKSHGDSAADVETAAATFVPDAAPEAPGLSQPAVASVNSPVCSPVLDRTVPDVPDAESDAYEPPEASSPIAVSSSNNSPPFSPAPPETLSQPAIVDDPVEADFDGEVDNGKSLLEQNAGIPSPIQINSVAKPEGIQSFTPYESPLKSFRAFRFHPYYQEQVPGGLRSLTFSHKINPEQEFCRYELAGGICNDATCDYQHFREIGLPDDAVLTALGSPEEFGPPGTERRDEFCDGLRGVLTGLRARKVKDFDVIAAEIIAHRTKFLGDDSKVLSLEGTIL